MANSGCESDARATEELFIRNFSPFEYIVIPSGSCTHHIRNKFIAAPPSPERDHVQSHVYDFVEFLHDVLKVKEFPWAAFPHKVALHTSHFNVWGRHREVPAPANETFHDWYRKNRSH